MLVRREDSRFVPVSGVYRRAHTSVDLKQGQVVGYGSTGVLLNGPADCPSGLVFENVTAGEDAILELYDVFSLAGPDSPRCR
jgi:hypothetical protein